MKRILLLLILAQVLFSLSDFLARANMPRYGFCLMAFFKPWFAGYVGVRILAVACTLYVYTSVELGKTRAIFGAISIVLANAMGYFLLNEALTVREYAGVAIAVAAFTFLALGGKVQTPA